MNFPKLPFPFLGFPLLGLAAASPLRADSVVTFSTNLGPDLVDSTGGQLPVHTLIRVGYFNTSGSNLILLQNSNSFAEVDSLFTPLAESRPNAGTVNQGGNTGEILEINDLFEAGDAFGQIEGISALYLAEGKQLAAWVMLGPSMQAIFTSSTGWGGPPDNGAASLLTSEVDTIYRGSLNLAGNIQMVAVPEPTVTASAAGAAALLLGRRRRRRRG